MKVTEISNISALVPAKPAEPTRAPSPRGGSEDRVSTRDSARIAEAVSQANQATAAARPAKLKSIEAAVRQGTYRPDPQRIAEEILDDAELAARLQALFQK
jgi:negative regulator of flagellin synthesis FlgM